MALYEVANYLGGYDSDMSTIVKGKLVSETSAYLLTRGNILKRVIFSSTLPRQLSFTKFFNIAKFGASCEFISHANQSIYLFMHLQGR